MEQTLTLNGKWGAAVWLVFKQNLALIKSPAPEIIAVHQTRTNMAGGEGVRSFNLINCCNSL